MSGLIPVSWNELVRKLKLFDFEGPFFKGRHPYMLKGHQRVTIPNPHKKKDIGIDLLARILKRAKIARDDWINK